MLYKNLTVKELYASIPNKWTIFSLFYTGLKMNNERLAISAMEELIVREAIDLVHNELKQAFEDGNVKVKTPMSTMIARSLSESCRGIDPFLHRFGKFLFEAKTNDSVKEFFECAGNELKESQEAKIRREKIAQNSFQSWMEEEIVECQNHEKPCLSDHRPADYFKIGDEVICFIPKSSIDACLITGFVTGKVAFKSMHYSGHVSVRTDKRVLNRTHNDNWLSFDITSPEIMHKWEYEYFKTHPEYLVIWCNKSCHLTYELLAAFVDERKVP